MHACEYVLHTHFGFIFALLPQHKMASQASLLAVVHHAACCKTQATITICSHNERKSKTTCLRHICCFNNSHAASTCLLSVPAFGPYLTLLSSLIPLPLGSAPSSGPSSRPRTCEELTAHLHAADHASQVEDLNGSQQDAKSATGASNPANSHHAESWEPGA